MPQSSQLISDSHGYLFIYLFGHATWLAGSEFPDQGLNPDDGSESPGILTTRPLVDSQNIYFFKSLQQLSDLISHGVQQLCQRGTMNSIDQEAGSEGGTDFIRYS